MTDRKERMLALKKELSERISKIDKDLHSRTSSTKFSEQVVDGQNDDVLLNLKNEALYELEQIDRALVKMSRDLYGICEKCHNDISPERLDAVPFAAQCKACAA
ncbi:TraR/DksA family transcriptional regulator [Ningiella sp. W23]|uniref:TraR/DksA family transcriptional regulator n=1 Tax=Ningiella sp. W23 TaxID=3023715 RepID=UPI003757E645